MVPWCLGGENSGFGSDRIGPRITPTALAEVVPASRLGTAYSVRSVMGFAVGAISPVVFGAALDVGLQRFGETSSYPWGLAWSTAGVGAMLGPVMILRFARFLQRRPSDPRHRDG